MSGCLVVCELESGYCILKRRLADGSTVKTLTTEFLLKLLSKKLVRGKSGNGKWEMGEPESGKTLSNLAFRLNEVSLLRLMQKFHNCLLLLLFSFIFIAASCRQVKCKFIQNVQRFKSCHRQSEKLSGLRATEIIKYHFQRLYLHSLE